MGSARSQKNFFDKQSEICQKISSSKKYTDMRKNVDFSKHPISIEIYTCMQYLKHTFYVFQIFVFFV